MPDGFSRLMPAIPYQILREGSKLKKTSCSSHLPERDSRRAGGVTRNTTGAPLTSRAGCQRTDHDLRAVLLRAGDAVWSAAEEKPARNTTASRTAKLLSPVAPGSRWDTLSTKTSLAPWQRLGAVIRGVRTWFFIIAIAGIADGCLVVGQDIPQSAQADRVVVVKKERTSHFDEPGED